MFLITLLTTIIITIIIIILRSGFLMMSGWRSTTRTCCSTTRTTDSLHQGTWGDSCQSQYTRKIMMVMTTILVFAPVRSFDDNDDLNGKMMMMIAIAMMITMTKLRTTPLWVLILLQIMTGSYPFMTIMLRPRYPFMTIIMFPTQTVTLL